MASSTVGVLAVQGDFDKHLEALADCGVAALPVRTVSDLRAVERLILPGGESSTTGLLLDRYGLGEAIKEAASQGMALWGTCMGMILLSTRVEGRDQYVLGLLDIDIRRNAFGAQVHSFEDSVAFTGLSQPVLGVFIRAPIVTRLGDGVKAVAEYNGAVVAVQSGRILGTSFHPELTEDRRLHEHFLSF